jgi:hypothetical protein
MNLGYRLKALGGSPNIGSSLLLATAYGLQPTPWHAE